MCHRIQVWTAKLAVAKVGIIRERGHGTRPKAKGFGPEDWSLYRMKKCCWKWLQMTVNGCEWLEMTGNGWKWLEMVADDCK